jgi:curli production assembly/transport component CsgF
LKRIVGLTLIVSALAAGSSFAGQLNYVPKNPTFGGNPNNGSFLLSTAQTQGSGVKSGQQSASPDLSGLDSALSNLGSSTGSSGSTSPIIVIGNGTVPTNP